MSAISGVGGASNAWAAANAQRAQHQAKMFAKVDSDGSGAVDSTELGSLLTQVAEKTGASLGDSEAVLSKMDSNSDGSLTSDELDQGMRALMPPPSTMAFAQSHGAVQDQGEEGVPSFESLDTDGNGELSQAEFEAGRPAPPPGGMGAPAGAGGASSSSTSSTYDPLDINEDGSVSEMERLAGALKELAQSAEGNPSGSFYQEIAKLAQSHYEQISANVLNTQRTSVTV
ncbi:MAG: EF-hand domain-containing protein [Hydrogenophaga sp.]|nr:EF-hand domain-containing protein [Hydrogenophaga sp.]